MIKYLVLFGIALQFIGVLLYTKDVIKGKTKPNRVTWLLWFVAPMIGASAAWSKGVRWPVSPAFMAGFGPFIVLVVSFLNPKAYWRLKTSDYICGLLSIFALILWSLTKEPNIAILFAILSDGFAALPTIAKSWHYPETETAWTYAFGVLSAFFGLLAVKSWVFEGYALPIYFILVNSSLVLSSYHKIFFRPVRNSIRS